MKRLHCANFACLLPRLSGRTGLTLVELTIGMVIVSLVMSALAAFSFAMAKSWRDNEANRLLVLSTGQATRLLQQEMRQVKCVGVTRAGSLNGTGTSACAMIWKSDTNSDGYIQFAEVALVEHNTSTQSIDLLDVSFPSNWTQSMINTYNVTVTQSEWTNSSAPENFKAWRKQINPNLKAKRLAPHVTAARFVMHSTSARPTLEYTMKFTATVGASTAVAPTRVEYGMVTFRGPQEPNFP